MIRVVLRVAGKFLLQALAVGVVVLVSENKILRALVSRHLQVLADRFAWT